MYVVKNYKAGVTTNLSVRGGAREPAGRGFVAAPPLADDTPRGEQGD